jgi:hypothetical protein
VTETCNGPVPVIRQTIFNSSPLRGGICPGPRARPHSWPWTLVPWISFGLPSVPNDEGVEHLALRGVAAPESEEKQLATPKRHPRTAAAQPARLLMTTECYARSTCRLREMVGPSESPRGSQTEQSVPPNAETRAPILRGPCAINNHRAHRPREARCPPRTRSPCSGESRTLIPRSVTTFPTPPSTSFPQRRRS